MADKGEKSPGIKMVAQNRRARHDYHFVDVLEAGLSLVGTEVKALREGRCSLQDSYAAIDGGELFVFDMHIGPYEAGNRFNHEAKRPRRLLVHKREIRKLFGATSQKGMTLIPLRLYFKRGKAKLEIALARGKRQYDKRESLRRKIQDRETERALSRTWRKRE
jgi:SsrA-binding protein